MGLCGADWIPRILLKSALQFKCTNCNVVNNGMWTVSREKKAVKLLFELDT